MGRYFTPKLTPESLDKKRKSHQKYWDNLTLEEDAERRLKLSKANTGKSPSEETKLKISKSLSGRPMPEDQRLSMLGREPWNKGVVGEEYKLLHGNVKNPPKSTGLKRITDDVEERWHPPDRPIPEGFRYGRLESNKSNRKPCKLIFSGGGEIEYPSAAVVKKQFNMSQKQFEYLLAGKIVPKLPNITKIEYILTSIKI